MCARSGCRRTIHTWSVAYVIRTWYVTFVPRRKQAPKKVSATQRVTFLAPRTLATDYRVVAKSKGLDLSSSLRLHMSETVADARANGLLGEAA